MPVEASEIDRLPALSAEERETYQWQTTVRNFGPEGQRRLKAASVLISRVGGVGSSVAYALAAAGVGKLVLAHAGNIRPDDLNRQLLMTHDAIGRPRVESARKRLLELNPRLCIETVEENVSSANAARLMREADLVVACAPLFEERLAMNAAAVEQGKPMVDCSMYEMEASITSILPGRSPCLACICRQPPKAWQRRFPVFGAVAAMIGSWGAMEAIKLISGLGKPLSGVMLMFDMGQGQVNHLSVHRDPQCPVCAAASPCALPASLAGSAS